MESLHRLQFRGAGGAGVVANTDLRYRNDALAREIADRDGAEVLFEEHHRVAASAQRRDKVDDERTHGGNLGGSTI